MVLKKKTFDKYSQEYLEASEYTFLHLSLFYAVSFHCNSTYTFPTYLVTQPLRLKRGPPKGFLAWLFLGTVFIIEPCFLQACAINLSLLTRFIK